MMPKFENVIPKCADKESVYLWLVAADSTYLYPPAAGFCTDCHPAYQARMIKDGRCENPDVRFMVQRQSIYGVIRDFTVPKGKREKGVVIDD